MTDLIIKLFDAYVAMCVGLVTMFLCFLLVLACDKLINKMVEVFNYIIKAFGKYPLAPGTDVVFNAWANHKQNKQ